MSTTTTSSLTPISSFKPMKKVRVLPLSRRPRPLSLQKKRPQSLLSQTTSIANVSSNSCGNSEDHPFQKQLKRTKVKDMKEIRFWDVGDTIDCLRDIPLFHTSPMTSLLIKCTNSKACSSTCSEMTDSISPSHITSIISQFVASISAIGDYNTQTACATIHTVDDVIFTIQLFKTQDHKHILMEIERKRGATIQFHYLAHTILNMMKRMESETSNHEGKDITAVINCDKKDSNEIESINSRERSDNLKFQEAMESICTFFQKDRLDAMLLGIESLLHMTTGDTSNKTISYLAVKSILQDGMWQTAKDFIFDLVLQNKNYDHDESCSMTQEMGFKMTQQSLEILANCLSFMVQHYNPELKMILKSNADEWKELLLSLEVKTDSKSHVVTQKSFQSARCFYYLVSSSRDMRDVACNSNVYEKAFEYDHRSHSDNQSVYPPLSDMMKLIVDILSNCTKR